MELFEAIEISALKSVLQPDNEYYLRRIFRWYSEKFHTPLHQVPDLPVEDVLQTYFEFGFEHMSKQKLNALAKKVTKDESNKPKKPRKPRKKVEKAEKKLSDDDFAKAMKEKSVEIVKTLEARNEERKKAALDMMESLDDMDPLAAAIDLPEINSKFNGNLE